MRTPMSIGIKLVLGLDIVWTMIVVLIFLAPYLASIDSPFAGLIYLFFKPTCHQMASRSFSLWRHQLPVCARCTGIWISLMIFGYIGTILLFAEKIKPLKLYGFAIGLIPLAIDGSTQLIGLWKSNNILRLTTGAISGAVIIWFIYPRIWWADKNWGKHTQKIQEDGYAPEG